MGTQAEIGTARKIAFVTSYTEQSTSDLEGVGTIRVDQHGRRYRWVKNSGDDAARAGSPACYDQGNVAQTYFLERIPVEDIASDDLPYFAGVWMAAVAGGSYGWILTSGVYDTGRIAAASATSYGVGALLKPNAATATDATGADAPYSFVIIAEPAITGTARTSITLGELMQPHAVLMDVCASRATAAALTTAQTLSILVKGLMS